ncbi:uncharacterized protein Dana_GF12958 [Drosophila ananassae]|uniref:Enkurin domain-containing protein n=1 Tax=Drosophila ananassae TaxID=7217 RepID=B3MDQ5_DROAN|nr:uncharacterized protein LOC6495802 [Drosophila ananassae]EDV36440.1 uncharacterized protein Dana_GF12958 [Drosophila ananassae]
MSNTSVRPIPTLKGMFAVPRVTQSRNFLKENKVSLRSLEKTTSQKLAAKEPVRPKWMPPLRRTASEARDPKGNKAPATKKPIPGTVQHTSHSSRSNNHLAIAIPAEGERFDGLEDRDPLFYAPSEPVEAENLLDSESEKSSERCLSCGTHRSSTSIGIQTEDIRDEQYLTNALKRCNFDGRSVYEDSRQKYGEDNRRFAYDGYDNEQELEQLPLSGRSNGSSDNRFQMAEGLETMPMPQVDPREEGGSDEEAPLSARSRVTMASNVTTTTTKSKRREHKMGSRDEVRLPKYLEKEKRERAEAKQRAESRDPDCPRGHVLLSDQERLSYLTGAQKRYEHLVNELNHMPMTAQTLRVRSRKAEIDRELATVEEEIRIYSKAKVYVMPNRSRQL